MYSLCQCTLPCIMTSERVRGGPAKGTTNLPYKVVKNSVVIKFITSPRFNHCQRAFDKIVIKEQSVIQKPQLPTICTQQLRLTISIFLRYLSAWYQIPNWSGLVCDLSISTCKYLRECLTFPHGRQDVIKIPTYTSSGRDQRVVYPITINRGSEVNSILYRSFASSPATAS